MEFKNQYLTFEKYQELGGTLKESAFNLLELEARKLVDKYTYGRLISLPTQKEETKICVLKLIGMINENNSTVLSESVDGYSITIMDKKELEKAYKGTITGCLSESKLDDGTPYLYAGKTRRNIIW